MMFDLTKDQEFIEEFEKDLKDTPEIKQLAPLGLEVYWSGLTGVEAKDCVGTWGRWKPCTSKCGYGMKYRKYKIIREPYLDGLECDDRYDKAKCWSGPCPELPTVEPTASPTIEPTPVPTSNCMSLTGKSDRQCARKCNIADSCPLTCRMCNQN